MISIDFDKARAIAHERRRRARAEAFRPHDERIKLMLPGDDLAELDAPRQAIREADALLQNRIDEVEYGDLDGLRDLIP